MEAFLAEKKGLKQGVLASVNATPAVGERIELKELKRVAILVQVAAAASAVLSLSLKQHNAASAGVTKGLEIANAIFHKVGAATSFTKVEPAVASDVVDVFALAGADKALVVVEVLQEDLDVNGDFNYISADIVGDATARIVGIAYVGDAEYCPAYALSL
jgi:hypothetical protein